MERDHRVALANLEHKPAEPRRQQAHHVDGDHVEYNRKDSLQNHAENIHRRWLLGASGSILYMSHPFISCPFIADDILVRKPVHF